jgi:cytochrome c
VGLEELSAIVFQTEPVKKPGYAIAVSETEAGAAAAGPELPPDWGTVLPTANVQSGQQMLAVCQTCHNFAKGGPNMTGPNQYGLVGRKPGTAAGYMYSQALLDFGAKNPSWDYDKLDQFIKAPQAFIPGTKMTFVGLKKQQDRINLIAYLRTVSDSPAPIPAPKPAAAPAASGAAPAASGAAPAASSAAPAAVKP